MGYTSTLDAFSNLHRNQLISSGVPECYWSVLNQKLTNQILDAGEVVQLMQIGYDRDKKPHEPFWTLQALCKIETSNPKHIYLIDHAWTFRIEEAKNQLIQCDLLRQRMNGILGLGGMSETPDGAGRIFQHLWTACQTYSVANAGSVEERLPIWYVMDEIGSSVNHSDSPNCRIVPFFYVNEQITYSLLFPIRDIEEDQFLCRDFAEGIVDDVQRKAALLPWVPVDFDEFTTEQPEMPGPDYYLSGHIAETLPNFANLSRIIRPHNLKVYSEYDLINQYLTDERFQFVNNEDEADVLWLTKHFRNFARLSESPHKFVNQFPFEYVLTVKDLLNLTCRRAENSSNWLPTTYNLKTDIAPFISCYQRRAKQGLDNHWIIKPYNLARSLDTHITNNLNYIVRLPATGPKIAQKYITDPVLFYRPECNGHVKFDIRYVVLLKSASPLEVFAYKNFFLRFANRPFELNDFHVYEKHFTVMNYDENVQLKRMLCSEFKLKWNEFYPNNRWNDVEESIIGMLGDIFQSAISAEPPCGIPSSPQSRALYAADIMLEWDQVRQIQPKILEINWTPDCKRACEYYPDFYNDIFRLLFIDETSDIFYKLL